MKELVLPYYTQKAKIVYNFGLSVCNRVRSRHSAATDPLLLDSSNSNSVISGRWADDNERLCGMDCLKQGLNPRPLDQ